MFPRHDEHLIRSPAPIRAEAHGEVGCADDPVVDAFLGGRRRADKAAAGETVEAGLFFGKLPRHEGNPEQLAVRVGDGGAGLAPVVDYHLAVTQSRRVLVATHPVSDGEHDECHLFIGKRSHRLLVVGREDEHFVDPARRSLGENRATVLHDKGLVPIEGRVAVRQHPHEPVARVPIDLEDGRSDSLHLRTERARDALEGVERQLARDKERLAMGAVGGHRYPPSRKRIKTKLVHAGLLASFNSRQGIVICLHNIAIIRATSGPRR